eukprot:5221063-Prymnesium_polylepis.1
MKSTIVAALAECGARSPSASLAPSRPSAWLLRSRVLRPAGAASGGCCERRERNQFYDVSAKLALGFDCTDCHCAMNQLLTRRPHRKFGTLSP